MLDLAHWQENRAIISLLLTRRCNFECEHCFYECGPYFRGYMNNEVLNDVKCQIHRLEDLGIRPTVNLIGGEPTLNMERFAEILAEVMSWDVSVDMTTNGWWLHKDATAREFFGIVARYADNDGYGLDTRNGPSFSIRISDDKYHDSFRPSWLQGGKMKRRLSDVWDNPHDDEILLRARPQCTGCYHIFKQMPKDRMCSKCGDHVEYEYEELLNWYLPEPNAADPWIYVESRRRDQPSAVAPIGRASSWGQSNVSCKKWSNANALSYLPNGKLMDICCKGAWCEFGTVEDDPLLLLELGRIFTEEEKPDCWDCREMAAAWKKRRLCQVKTQLRREIASLNRELDIVEWWNS